MKIIDQYLNILNERRRVIQNREILYHGSKIQNLKVIDPSQWVDALLEEHVETIWASWDIQFATMFCIDWRKNMDQLHIGTDISYYSSLGADPRSCVFYEPTEEVKKMEAKHCQKMRDNPSWFVGITLRYKSLLQKPCSLYLIKGEDWVVPPKRRAYNWEWPEAYSKKPAKVIKEIKYSSVEEAYKKNKVKFIVERHPVRSKWWDVIFSKLKR